MLDTYPQLQELLGRAVVEDLTCTLELDAKGPISANEIPGAISRALVGWSSVPALVAGLTNFSPTWVGRNRTLRLQWPALISTIKADQKKLDPGIRFGFETLMKHATILHKNLSGLATVRFAAFVVDLQFSTMNPTPLPNAGIVVPSFMNLPASLGPLVDGEWRAAKKTERYYTNWTLNTFETRQIRAQAAIGPLGPAAPAEITQNLLLDAGLRLRVDVNTKVNVLEGTGEIVVDVTDFTQLRDLGIDGAKAGVKMLEERSR